MKHAVVVALVGGALLLAAVGAVAWADVGIPVSPPPGTPDASNGYNITVVGGSGQPIQPGELITFTSSSEIAGISLDRGARAENPYRLDNGSSAVDIKVDHPGHANGIIRFKDGTKRGVVILVGATKVDTLRITRDGGGNVWVTASTNNDLFVVQFKEWTPRSAPPASSPDQQPGHSEGKSE